MKPDQTGLQPYQLNLAETCAFLEKVLHQQVQPKAMEWLHQQQKKIKEDGSKLFLSFSLASRFFDSESLHLAPEQVTEAEALRIGFMPQYWTQLQLARTLLLLELSELEEETFIHSLTRLAETADVAEQIALYGALPVLPYPLALRKRAAEGIRTNITGVFDAIALHNPYPADYLEEGAWNQMLLKAVFLSRPLYQIWGADKRANPALAQMLLDFAHERWAAHRTVTPEIWRFVGPYLQKENIREIEQLSKQGTPLEKKAVLLACAGSELPEAEKLLAGYPEEEQQIRSGEINWVSLGRQYAGE
ncbi:EboA domain-containing protein [Cesiribacter sp. SM1]|uniref:EboA domain-containing protein n=1 Tax=Cesiribacter sp. SM1 TaxID=2861196 RepID=UPI001CD61025|nr:EboA domain-containing protein [Cesiribacter sp. SM1]